MYVNQQASPPQTNITCNIVVDLANDAVDPVLYSNLDIHLVLLEHLCSKISDQTENQSSCQSFSKQSIASVYVIYLNNVKQSDLSERGGCVSGWPVSYIRQVSHTNNFGF